MCFLLLSCRILCVDWFTFSNISEQKCTSRCGLEDGYFQKQMSFADGAFVRTMDVFDHVDAEAVSGDGGEHLASTPPPGQVVRRTPGGDGTKQ